MFIGAAGGIALSHLPGLSMIAGAAMGIGAMTVAMLGLPLVALLLVRAVPRRPTALPLTPLVIVADRRLVHRLGAAQSRRLLPESGGTLHDAARVRALPHRSIVRT